MNPPFSHNGRRGLRIPAPCVALASSFSLVAGGCGQGCEERAAGTSLQSSREERAPLERGGPFPSDEAVEPECPVAGMTLIPASPPDVRLGSERSCSQFPNILMAGPHAIDRFCMSTFPFPGEGAWWAPPPEAPEAQRLSYDEVLRIDRLLRERFGLRLCSAEEYLWAGAGPENRRFPYGSERIHQRCSEDADGTANDGYRLVLGEEDCPSWAGVQGIGLRNTWAVLDESTRAQANAAFDLANTPTGCAYPPAELKALPAALELIVMGAVSGTDENPGNMSGDLFGFHHHAFPGAFYDAPPNEQGEWQDDLIWVCAAPRAFDPAVSDRWRRARGRFYAAGDFDALWDERPLEASGGREESGTGPALGR